MSLFQQWGSETIATAVLVLFVLMARGAAVGIVRRGHMTPDDRRRSLAHIRTAAILFLLFGAVVVWAEELRSVALSAAAVAVAVTIATKELLLCLSGALLRTSARAFSIGDRIQLAGYRGDVIDIRALSITILEVDELTHRRTGRSITLPNSLLLDKAALNETFAASYVLSVLNVPLEKGVAWEKAEVSLLEAAAVECEPFLDAAKEEISRASKLRGLDVPIVDPTVSLVLDKPGEMKLLLRYPTPVRRSNRVGQAILRHYLKHAPKPAPAPPSPDGQSLVEPDTIP